MSADPKLLAALLLGLSLHAPRAAAQQSLAPTPPMGWNSWDAYGTTVTEAQVKANADAMARGLARFGYRYVVVDIQWYQPTARGHDYEPGAALAMDAFGRLVPAINKFPSSARGAGFKPLADFVHALGLKFGIHIMRGIPRQAVTANTPIPGTPYHAADVADTTNGCAWNPDMWGVDVRKPGGQAYYDAIARLYASWGVDFVKADDMGSHRFQPLELRALRRALDRSGRRIVLSISPGPAPVDSAAFFARSAQMWRISDDFWDEWRLVRAQFDYARDWARFVGLRHAWPDADMLPLGRLRLVDSAGRGTPTRLTRDEQRTVMTLWSAFRSPLIIGGDLPTLDDSTLALLTNPEVLAMHRYGEAPGQVLERPGLRVWRSTAPGSGRHYVAVFNLDSLPQRVDLAWSDIGLDPGSRAVRDLWERRSLEPTDRLRLELAPHASAAYLVGAAARAQTWTADLGNGTYANPLFYDEFSDPDVIRVGDDFYLTGTTMHSMPGLPILHSRDLVNWELLGYAMDRLDLGPAYRLEGGGQIYGRGIWAPSFRYHAGTFYIFSNVNGRTTQLFRATDPRGPWTRTAMKVSLHDLSVLFDDDGAVWVVWGYRDLHLARLDSALTDTVPGAGRVLFGPDSRMGEGSHFYKIHGRYYITSAWYAQRMRLACARADRLEGPWEVNPEISADEDFGLQMGHRLRGTAPPFDITPPDPESRGHLSLHQGGIVDTPEGEWWGLSMMDANSVGRLTALSPVTWQDGWPYYGLPGNLERTPRIWVKPRTAFPSRPTAPYQRNDDFSGPALANVWQWNHVPVDSAWSLAERPGFLRLHALLAQDLWWARNTLTQRAIGPQSEPTAVLETAGMRPGDVAGLALFNFPYAWIGVRRDSGGFVLEQFDQATGRTERRPLRAGRVWLRAWCDFLTEQARFSFSTDGRRFAPLGGPFTMVFQLTTFQGVRYALFAYAAAGGPGGWADFDAVTVREPHPRGLTRPIPVGRTIAITTARGGLRLAFAADSLLAVRAPRGPAAFRVVDRGLGRVALRAGAAFATVDTTGAERRLVLTRGDPGDAATFQWIETPYADLALLSLATHRYLRLSRDGRAVTADAPGPAPDRADGVALTWRVVPR